MASKHCSYQDLLFEKYQDKIVKLQYKYIYPEIKRHGKEYDFHIKFNDKHGFMPNKTRNLPKIRVTKEDGSAYPEGTTSFLVNNYFAYMWSLIKVSMFNTELDNNYNVGHVSTLKKRANISNEGEGSGQASGFIAEKKYGLIKGDGLFYPTIDMGDLIPGFFDDISGPIFGVDIHIVMTLKDDLSDSLFTFSDAEIAPPRGKINLESYRLKVWYIEYDEITTTNLIDELKHFSLAGKYAFTYKCFQCVEYRGLPDLNTLRMPLNDFVFTQEPNWAFVFFIKDKFLYDQNENPTNWDHANIKNIQILYGEERHPSEPQNYEIEKGDYYELYRSSSEYDEALYGPDRMISQFHTVDNFIKYNCFFNIDLRNKPKSISTVEKLPKILIADSSKSFKGLNCYVVFVNQKTIAYDMVMSRMIVQYF